jgi:hypothetical protein
MTDTRATTRISNSELARALAQWESEGGASFQPTSRNNRDDHAFLAEPDKRVLQCLGAAVIVQWNYLPSRIQRQLFNNAASIGEPRHTSQWKEQIARFLHNHKDDIWNRKTPAA